MFGISFECVKVCLRCWIFLLGLTMMACLMVVGHGMNVLVHVSRFMEDSSVGVDC